LIDKGIVIPYKILLYRALSGRNSAVECQLPKLDVTGSIPVARSNFFPKHCRVQSVKSFKLFKSSSTVIQIDSKMLNFLNCLNVLNFLSHRPECGNIQRNKVSKNQFESNKKRS
jgi:hypothetical protein